MATPNDIVTVAEVPSEPLAGMYTELLRRHGIQSQDQPQGPGYGGWASVSTVPHRILVMRNVFETAYDLLLEYFGDDYLNVRPEAASLD